MPSHLHLEKINKNYEDLKALNNLAFDAHQGQLISLVGANGSGKTTLLRIMAGLDFPNNGKIIFNGKELNIH
ncbi:MAG: ATP-binding cassette domain-containing protein, partial [Candidatus Bathyarchaeia archaeon]